MSVVSKGLEGIVAAETRLGEVKGAEGVLFYCGYDITDLAEHSEFAEVAYLLWTGRLPNEAELETSTKHLAQAESPIAGARDLLWALINTKEFIVNH